MLRKSESGVFETQTFQVCPTEQIICVKEDCYAIPKFLSGTSLNANIPRLHPNFKFHSKALK